MRGKSVPERPLERACVDCQGQMEIIHKGEFSTVFACAACGITMTIPPKIPLASRKKPSRQ